jgi:hypothetical protein
MSGSSDAGEKEQRPLYFCRVPDCKARSISFTRQGDMNRHTNEQHSPDRPRYVCGCCRERGQRSFLRKDRLINHLRSAHHMQGNTSWTCLREPCSMENQEVHFTSRSERDQHILATHRESNLVSSESKPEQSKPEFRRLVYKSCIG